MSSLTNNFNLSLPMAVWLAHDEYENGQAKFSDKTVISITELLKPVRQSVLKRRVPPEDRILDVTDLIASRFGTAMHDSIEAAWLKGYKPAMKRLGYSEDMINRIRINPEPGTLDSTDLPIYLEQRSYREIEVDGYEIVVSGKFDQVIDGELNDTKSTSTFAYMKKSKDKDFALQGSGYRWLNPDIVTKDVMKIQYVFTDWQKFRANTDPNYPQHRVLEEPIPLLSTSETETWIFDKIRTLIKYQNSPQSEIPQCTPEELWMSEPSFKYYADPAKAASGGRSTKNFASMPEAQQHRAKAGKGVIITVPGEPKACSYCPAFSVCSQKDSYGITK